MNIETLSNTIDENDKHILLIRLGNRIKISVRALASLLIENYKTDNNYIGYHIIGEIKSQQTEIKKLKELLNWNEVQEVNLT